MKINFRNRAARLKLSSSNPTCRMCPFHECIPCPFYTFTDINCDGKGWWIDGEALDIFRV